MANSLLQNPWLIDTPTLFSLCTGMYVRIKHIRLVGGTTAGHVALLVDDSSNVVWRTVVAAANFVESDLHHNEVAVAVPVGLRAAALQSGTLFVTYG